METQATSPPEKAPARTIAAIDVGANSLRMVVAEVLADGRIEALERLQRAVRLGQDAFRRGRLGAASMRTAVVILRDYQQLLNLYHVERVRAVATSAVREAGNADTFLDRVYMATGLHIEVIGTPEESRLTVSAVCDAMGDALGINHGSTLIADVGGGSTLLTLLQDGEIVTSQSLRLGSIRLKEMLVTSQESPERSAELLSYHIANVLSTLQGSLPLRSVQSFVAVGGDARFAARQIGRPTDREDIVLVEPAAFDKLVDRCERRTTEDLAKHYGITFAESETLNPALLVYQKLLRLTQAPQIIVSHVSMRDGLLLELARAVTGQEDHTLLEGVIHSAMAIAQKYHADMQHAQIVADISVRLFDELRAEHGLPARCRLLLQVAGLLHEIGGFVSSRSHHKHSYYLIANSEIFGLNREETMLVAQVARYHRRSGPKPSHLEYMALPREARVTVNKLAALLRVADAVARGHIRGAGELRFERQGDDLIVCIPGVPDLLLEERATEVKGDLFEDIYGMKVRLEAIYMAKDPLRSPALYINRELSWLEFNDRVLREGLAEDVPLLERVKFLAIVSSNLDEFFLVRVAGLMQAQAAGVRRRDPAGMTPAAQLEAIAQRVHRMVDQQSAGVRDALEKLAEHGLSVLEPRNWTAEQRQFLQTHFVKEILPVLTPLAVQEIEPPPLLPGLQWYVAAVLASGRAEGSGERIVVTPVPSQFARWITLPSAQGVCLARLEDVIAANAAAVFSGCEVLATAAFRITRDADVAVQREESDDMLEAVERAVLTRRRRSAVRLQISPRPDRRIRQWLTDWLHLQPEQVYEIDLALDGAALMEIANWPGFEQLKNAEWPPQPPRDLLGAENLWEAILDHDVLLLHPYESFDPVVRLVEQAAEDPQVLAIKQTLYRTSGDSPIVRALGRAAQRGKEVTVLVELRARFDEARNIQWARRLEDAGCHVIYGIAGYKTHAKALLIVRREPSRIQRYVHLATGNYNDKTARLYSDLGLMTCDREVAADVAAFFNLLTGCSETVGWSKITIAPTGLRQRFIELIEREMQVSTPDRPGLIMVKINSLQDTEICRALYRASQAGVRIMLNVRGVCVLRPGIEGVSDNIEVRSIVDRFLEHARIFYFRNGGNEEVYLSSADWMRRNLVQRLEILFPVEDANLRRRLIDILNTLFADNVKARRLLPDGAYELAAREGPRIRAQAKFYKDAVDAVRLTQQTTLQFRPLTRPDK